MLIFFFTVPCHHFNRGDMTLVLAAEFDCWALLRDLDARIRAFCDAHGWHFPEHQQEKVPMSTTTHTPFTDIAKEHGMDLLEAIMTAQANGIPISYNGMIGNIEGPDEGDLFAFVCPEAGFEDFVPADSLAMVN